MKKKRITRVICFLILWFITLNILVIAESASTDASITSFSDALWYSLVTLSTVGYGDLYPVTIIGRVIGLMFVLMSTGLLTLIITMMISLVTGRLLPDLKLKANRNKEWFIFSDCNSEAIYLAEDIMKNHSEAVMIFPDDSAVSDKFIKSVKNIDDLLKINGNSRLIFIGSNESENYRQAKKYAGNGIPVYCRCRYELDDNPDIVMFNEYSDNARLFWMEHPLKRAEKSVVIIGCENYGSALLEQALQVNVFSENQRIRYHIFAENDKFIREHSELSSVFSIGCVSGEKDSLIFYSDEWYCHQDIIRECDRLIVCCDDMNKNIGVYSEINHFCPVKCSIYVRTPEKINDKIVNFGTDESIYTEDIVLKEKLNNTAVALNEIYRKMYGGNEWKDLTSFFRRSNVSAADHIQTKIRILLDTDEKCPVNKENLDKAVTVFNRDKNAEYDRLQSVEHERWMRFYALNNWKFAESRDNSKRLHPSMIEYSRLTPEERAKDLNSWELMEKIKDEI